MSPNKISIYIETNTKIEYSKYTIYKATLYLTTILFKNVFLKRSVWMAGIPGDLFLKLYLVILVSGSIVTQEIVKRIMGQKGNLRALTALTLSYATTPGARKSGRLREVVVQGKNQENMLKLNWWTGLQKVIT